MRTIRNTERLINAMNVLILLAIAAVYAVTGTEIGTDAAGKLSDQTVYRAGADGKIALECLVTWDAEALSDIAETLTINDADATFFVSGLWAKEHADELLKLSEAGFEIGTTGYDPSLDGDRETVMKDLNAAKRVIESVTGKTVRYYHAGRRDKTVSARAAKALGLVHVAESADLLSARGAADEIVSRASNALDDGNLILIEPTSAVKTALPLLIQLFRANGLNPTSVGSILKGEA